MSKKKLKNSLSTEGLSPLRIILWLFFILITNINFASAENNRWLLEWIEAKQVWKDMMTWTDRIRTWEIQLSDIPNVIHAMINIFIWIAWTVSVLFVIIWAYKILFGSFENDHTKWRDTIVMAITGFAISVLAWFIVRFIFDNFG